MKIEKKREALKDAYPGSGEKWAKKVDNMTDTEVSAMYLRLKDQGKVT